MPGNMRTFLLMAAMTALLMGMGWLIGGQGGAVLALVFDGVGNIWAWWNSDKAVLRQHGAMPVTEAEAPDLVRMVRALADRAGLPMPKVYVLATEQPNAFATERNPENSAVAVTQGLLNHLSADEIEGVIAHELAHIRHRDTLTMTVTATMAGAIAMMGLGNGMVLPNANAGMMSVRPELAGTASGLGGALAVAGGAALSALAGALLQPGSGATPLLAIMCASALGGLLAITWVLRRERQLALQG